MHAELLLYVNHFFQKSRKAESACLSLKISFKCEFMLPHRMSSFYVGTGYFLEIYLYFFAANLVCLVEIIGFKKEMCES